MRGFVGSCLRVRTLAPLALAALIAASVLAATIPSEAAPGGRGKKGGDETLSVAPAGDVLAAAVASTSDESLVIGAYGEWYVVTGSGFEPNSPVFMGYHEPYCCAATTVWTDDDGNFTTMRTTGVPGLYTVNAQVKSGNKIKLAASVSFEVQ